MPVAYLALARGDSRTYLMMEVAYNVFLILVVPLAYYFGGLQTTGWALSAAGLFDFLIVNIFYCRKYAYRFQKLAFRPISCTFSCLWWRWSRLYVFPQAYFVMEQEPQW